MAGGGFKVCGHATLDVPHVLIYRINAPAASVLLTYGDVGQVGLNTTGTIVLGPQPSNQPYGGFVIWEDRSQVVDPVAWGNNPAAHTTPQFLTSAISDSDVVLHVTGGATPAGRINPGNVISALSASSQQLQPVAPRISGVEAADAGKRVVPLDVLAGGLEPRRELLELFRRDAKRRMRFPRRRERLLDADMELAAAAEREPDAAARAQRRGLLQLLQAEQAAEEPPRLGLAARRRCELHVV